MQTVVRRPKRLTGSVLPPGDKSISHRAAIFNAIAEGEARIDNFSDGEDCQATLWILRQLGVQIEGAGSSFTVRGGELSEPADVLDAANSSTTMRLMAGVLATQPFLSVLTGKAPLRARPMDRVVEPLRLMGAQVDGRQGGTMAPLTIRGRKLRGIEYRMDVASAEAKGALLLAGLAAEGETTIDQPAPPRDHSELLLRAMGAVIVDDGLRTIVRPGRIRAVDVNVPGDMSAAAYWLVAAVCHPDAEIRIRGVGTNPSRSGILDVLRAMGADVSVENEHYDNGEPVADLVARSSELEAAEVHGEMVPRLIDEVPVIALAACFAKGTTVIRDAAELRVKESDRLHTVARELTAFGADVTELNDGLRIVGGRKLRGTTGCAHADHRVAMTLGVAGLLASGETRIDQAEVASASYPSFWDDLSCLEDGAAS